MFCMNNRYDDPNWGRHGNPRRDDWYQFSRNYQRSDFDLYHKKSKSSPWTIVWVILFIIMLGGFSETARGVIFYGINLTETWYSSVDSMLDALGAPKLP